MQMVIIQWQGPKLKVLDDEKEKKAEGRIYKSCGGEV